MKLTCPNCGMQYDSGKFCQECGTKLQEVIPELVCPSCGYKAKSGKFCPECGTRLTEQTFEQKPEVEEKIEERKFNEKDERFAKYYDKKGFPRTIPQEERDVAIEELTPYADQGIAEAKMLLASILLNKPKDKDTVLTAVKLLKEAEDAGDKFAYYLIGYGYFQGWEPLVELNHDEAEKRFVECYNEYKDGSIAGSLAELYTYSEEKCDYKKAYEFATIAAEDDEAEGYLILGWLYLDGLGVDKDLNLALENYKMAAALGNDTAMNQIGYIYMGQEGFEADPEQAFYWFNEAAKNGLDVGYYNLGCCYRDGFGVDEDAEKAADCFKKSAEMGYVNAMLELGIYYQSVLYDPNKAILWFQKAADLGDIDAMCELGKCYQNNPQDLDKAKMWLQKAADLGHAEATNTLGVIYMDNDNNPKEAVKCFSKAAELKYPDAYINLGLCYRDGNGVKQNLKKAEELLAKASKLGVEDADEIKQEMTSSNENELLEKANSLLEKGRIEDAAAIYKKLAEKGNAQGQGLYGNCLLHALGTKQNLKEGIEWLEKSASQEYAWACMRLVEAYIGWSYNGKTIKTDLQKAKEYLQKALSYGANQEEVNKLALTAVPSAKISKIKINHDLIKYNELGFEVVFNLVANGLADKKLNFTAYSLSSYQNKKVLNKPASYNKYPEECCYMLNFRPPYSRKQSFFVPYNKLLNTQRQLKETLFLMVWDITNKKPEVLACEEIAFSISCVTHMFKSNEWSFKLEKHTSNLIKVSQKNNPLLEEVKDAIPESCPKTTLPMDDIKKAAEASYPKESLKDIAVAALKIAEVIEDRLPEADVSYMVHPSEFNDNVSKNALPIHFLFRKDGIPKVAVVAVAKEGYRSFSVLETESACKEKGIKYVRVFANGPYADWIHGWKYNSSCNGPVAPETVEFCKNWLVEKISQYL